MKEYIAKEDLYKIFNEENVAVDQVNKCLIKTNFNTFKWEEVILPTVTKADICREFFEELRTRMYQGRDTSYQGMCDKGYELLVEMEEE